jgi:hypothetical protein
MHIAFLAPSTIEFEADEHRWDEPSAINDDSNRSGQANVYGVNTRRYHQIKLETDEQTSMGGTLGEITILNSKRTQRSLKQACCKPCKPEPEDSSPKVTCDQRLMWRRQAQWERRLMWRRRRQAHRSRTTCHHNLSNLVWYFCWDLHTCDSSK